MSHRQNEGTKDATRGPCKVKLKKADLNAVKGKQCKMDWALPRNQRGPTVRESEKGCRKECKTRIWEGKKKKIRKKGQKKKKTS